MRQSETISALSVNSFCQAHSISRALFYKLLRDGEGPMVIKAGRRTIISLEAAEAWRKQMESVGPARCHVHKDRNSSLSVHKLDGHGNARPE
jgi:predicted DNA-binding transcriptional regulator AlpA